MTQQSTPVMLVVLDPTVNIQQLCRLCGSKTEIANRLNIFDINVALMNLTLKIKTCLGFDIDDQDNLPKVICLSCVNKLENFNVFKTTCERTAQLLASLCNEQVVSNANLCSEQSSLLSGPPLPVVDTALVEPERVFIKSYSTDVQQIIQVDSKPPKISNNISTRSYKSVKNQTQNVCENVLQSRRKPLSSTFTCELCCKTFGSRKSVYKHMTQVHFPPKGRVVCKICNKSLKDKQTLKCHMLRHKKKFSFICDTCGQGFLCNSALEIHVRMIHTNERPFECLQCDKKFKSKTFLKGHVSAVHNDGSVQWICDVCNKSFACKQYLRIHKKSHSLSSDERKKLQCTICHFKFEHAQGLRNHMRTHTGEKPFECNLCNNRYAGISGLKIHMLTHTGERKHICDVCGSAFALPGTLKIHKLSVHEGVKMFKCNDCDKSYTQNKNLNIHLRKTGHTKLKK